MLTETNQMNIKTPRKDHLSTLILTILASGDKPTSRIAGLVGKDHRNVRSALKELQRKDLVSKIGMTEKGFLSGERGTREVIWGLKQ